MVIRTFEQKRLQPCKCIVLQNLVVSPQNKEKREKCFLFYQTIWIFSEVYRARSNFSSITLHENWRADW